MVINNKGESAISANDATKISKLRYAIPMLTFDDFLLELIE